MTTVFILTRLISSSMLTISCPLILKYNYTLSNYNHIPKWLDAINAKPISLGLDLKGGVHFLLQIDTDNVVKSRLNQIESNLRNFLIDNGIRYTNVIAKIMR